MNNNALLAAWVRQQKELGMPDPVLEQGAAFMQTLRAPKVSAVAAATPMQKRSAGPSVQGALRPKPISATNPLSRLAKLAPVSRPTASAPSTAAVISGAPETAPLPGNQLNFEQKRAIFKELFAARCAKCQLAAGRKNFVFGAGNVDANVMIVGEAPGQEEDIQGLPFVGPAGKLLSEMLAAVAIDRKKEVFITNILKCRPPGNRTPESAEILACMPLLEKQIAIVRPKFLLLLGRIAAHSLLELTDSISKMRAKVHDYRGIPAIVTYHPAAILRNVEYRAPTDEDLRKLATLLKESGHHGDS